MSSHPEATPEILRDPRVRAAYAETAGIYRIVPAGVAVPRNVAELQELAAWASGTETPLVPRGAGSGIPGNAVGAGVIVDLRERMPRILEIDAAAGTALTSGNITQAELNAAAGTHGLRLPPDPSSSGWATLAGMTATNAAGARSVRYGPVRPWVLGVEIVTADGEVCWLGRGQADGVPGTAALERLAHTAAPAIRAAAGLIERRFPRVRKNTAGYALDHWLQSGDDLDLIIGSEGTLAFITRIQWRLCPVAAARTGVRIALRSLADLEPAVRALVALDPSAVELLDRTFLDIVRLGGAAVPVPPGAEAVLLVEFERESGVAAADAAAAAARAVGGVALEVETALTAEAERQLWLLRHAASPILAGLPSDRRSIQVIEDGCVPLPRLGEYIQAVRASASARGITVVIFGHAGDGNIHVNALPDIGRPGWLAGVRALYDEVSAAAIRLGGTVSGEHGDGRLRAPLLEAQYGPDIVALFRAVKTAFDPRGILNPGVKLGAAGGALAGLKFGPDAAAIPEDLAQAFREIEQRGGYARSRLALAAAPAAGPA